MKRSLPSVSILVGVWWRKFGKSIKYVLFVLIIGLLLYIFITRVLVIKSIEVEGDGIGVIVDSNRLSKNLLFFPAEKEVDHILRDNPLIESVRFKKKFPTTLVVVATTRKPYARLQSSSFSYLIDSTGVIVGNAVGQDSLPVLQMDITPLAIGEKIQDDHVLYGLRLLQSAKDLFAIHTITIVDSNSLQAKGEKINILFPQNGDIGYLSSTLQTLFEGFRIKGTVPTSVDLRFDKPIVTF